MCFKNKSLRVQTLTYGLSPSRPVPAPRDGTQLSPPLGRRTAAGECVFVQEGHSAEGTGARPTLVLLHFGVGLQVSPQVRAVCKRTVTVGAREGALALKQR